MAAHLEPDILVVDEVLAVGDAEFQKKAIGKMQEVSQGKGRTVLFVSHNMTSIANLCKSVIVMERGRIAFQGSVDQGISYYLANNSSSNQTKNQSLSLDDEDFKLEKVEISQNERTTSNFITSLEIAIKLTYIAKRNISGLRIGFDLRDDNTGIVIFRSFNDDEEPITYSKNEIYLSMAKIPGNLLKSGNYTISLAIGIHNVRWITLEEICIPFCLTNIDGINKNYADNRPGLIMPRIEWNNTNKDKQL